MLPQWCSHERATSRGSRPTHRYVTRSSKGSPSSGECVLMKRRCSWASSSATTSSSGRVSMSSHGEIRASGRSNVVESKISSAQSICVQVVPLFGGVLMTMSSGRKRKPSQRLLSYTMFR